MNEKLLLLKIKLSLARLKISESYRASNYLAEIILYMVVNGDDSKTGFQAAVEIVAKRFEISRNSVVLGISGILRSCELSGDERFARGNVYKKVKYAKDYIIRTMKDV